MSTVKEMLVEQIGDDFGVTVRYEMDEYASTHIDFFAAEVIGVDTDGVKFYERAGASSSEDDTDDFDFAARLVSGSVKWDGCSHYVFGDKDGYLHMHGREDVEKLFKALEAIYERCGELMKSNGGTPMDGEFVASR